MTQLDPPVMPPQPQAVTEEKRPCPYCGVWNRLEFSFCEVCGRQLPQRAASPARPAAPPPPEASVPPPPPPSTVPPPPSIPAPPVWQAPQSAAPQVPPAVPSWSAPPSPTPWASPPTPYAAQGAYPSQPVNAAAPPYGSAPVVPEPEDVPAYDRPLTEAEWGLLKGGLNAQKVRLPRFLAVFIGIMPLAMIFMAFMGAPFIPEDFMAIVLVTGFLGLALGLAARGAGAPVSGAMRRGVAREVYGVPEVSQASATNRTVALGGVTFTMGNDLADRLLPDRMNRITYTTAGVLQAGPKTAAAMAGRTPAWVLDWNGTPAAKLESVTVDEAGKIPDMPGVSAPPPGRGPR